MMNQELNNDMFHNMNTMYENDYTIEEIMDVNYYIENIIEYDPWYPHEDEEEEASLLEYIHNYFEDVSKMWYDQKFK